ncbi:hypothetical protein YT1_0373 [Rhodococcus ruber]|nr:hypothetical protein YT1_0373 [Rhodococcus ruber]
MVFQVATVSSVFSTPALYEQAATRPTTHTGDVSPPSESE